VSRDEEIWVGDLVRALAALRGVQGRRDVGDVTPAAIGRLLGLTPRAVAGPEASSSPPLPESRHAPSPGPAPGDQAGGDPADALDDVPLLKPAGGQRTAGEGWLPGESLPRVTIAQLGVQPPHMPLLAPRSATSAVRTLLAQQADDGPVDAAALVDAIAGRRPLPRIPREPMTTLRFGAQLLLDAGEGMEPFVRDEELLAEQVRQVAGTATRAAFFADCPLRGAGSGSAGSWDQYTAPPPQTRVLVVSDFGIGGPVLHARRSRPQEWTAFFRLLASAHCSVTGLVPYPPSRWPASIARQIPLVSWDRRSPAGALALSVTRTGP
jgi:hypothetical protein